MSKAGVAIVVEDNQMIRDLIEHLLSRHFARVVGFEDGWSAWEFLLENEASAIVSDVGMAGMDGWELLRRSKSAFPGTKFILMSGYDWEKPDNAEPEADAFLLKPFRIDDLIQAAVQTGR